MKRENLNYGHMINCDAIAEGAVFADPEKIEKLDVSEDINPNESFLRLVYAPDPVSKLPMGDLVYMVSDKANPEVKVWVMQNLQMDTSSAQNLVAPKGLSDDDVIELTRKSYESVEAYANRINVYLNNNKRLVEDEVRRTQPNVSPKSSETPVSAE